MIPVPPGMRSPLHGWTEPSGAALGVEGRRVAALGRAELGVPSFEFRVPRWRRHLPPDFRDTFAMNYSVGRWAKVHFLAELS